MAQAQSIGTRLQADEIRLKAEAALHSGFNELQQLGRAMSVYDQPLMTQTLELLKESVKGGLLCGSRPDLPQPASLHGTGMPISESGSHAV